MRLVAREEPTHSCVLRSTARAMALLVSMLVPLAFVLNLVSCLENQSSRKNPRAWNADRKSESAPKHSFIL